MKINSNPIHSTTIQWRDGTVSRIWIQKVEGGNNMADDIRDTTDQSIIRSPGDPKARNYLGEVIDAPVSGFTSDENQGETEESPPVDEPSDEAAKDLKEAQKKKK